MAKIVSLVSFDATNTLLKFNLPVGVAYQRICGEFGVTVDSNTLEKSFRRRYKEEWKRMPNFGHGSSVGCRGWWQNVVSATLHDSGLENNSANKTLIGRIFHRLYDAYATAEMWKLTENAVDVLEKLCNGHRKLVVISNSDNRLDSILTSLKIRHFFDVVLNSYEVGFYKPQREIFDLALSMADSRLNPDEAVHIGDDAQLDFHAAKAAGWHGLLFNTRTEKPDRVEEAFIVKSLVEVNSKIQHLR